MNNLTVQYRKKTKHGCFDILRSVGSKYWNINIHLKLTIYKYHLDNTEGHVGIMFLTLYFHTQSGTGDCDLDAYDFMLGLVFSPARALEGPCECGLHCTWQLEGQGCVDRSLYMLEYFYSSHLKNICFWVHQSCPLVICPSVLFKDLTRSERNHHKSSIFCVLLKFFYSRPYVSGRNQSSNKLQCYRAQKCLFAKV